MGKVSYVLCYFIYPMFCVISQFLMHVNLAIHGVSKKYVFVVLSIVSCRIKYRKYLNQLELSNSRYSANVA